MSSRSSISVPLTWLMILFPVLAFPAAMGIGYFRALRSPGLLLVVGETYDLLTLWLPLLCFAAAGGLWWRGRVVLRRLAMRGILVLAMLGGTALLLRIWATHIEPHLFQIREVRIRSPKIQSPVRLLHISDIQTDRVGWHDRRAFQLIRRLKPDLIIHTGDLLQPIPPETTLEGEWPKLAELWASVSPPLGKFNVIGDADRLLVESLSKAGTMGGLQTLHSSDAALTVGQTRLRLFGLSLMQSRGGHGMPVVVSAWLANGSGAHDFNILLGHAPDFALTLPDIRKRSGLSPDLSLAGHTHGGQVRLPFYGPPILYSRVPREWGSGFHATDCGFLNVSAGLGTEHDRVLPPIRFNCPPEMTLLELLPEG